MRPACYTGAMADPRLLWQSEAEFEAMLGLPLRSFLTLLDPARREPLPPLWPLPPRIRAAIARDWPEIQSLIDRSEWDSNDAAGALALASDLANASFAGMAETLATLRWIGDAIERAESRAEAAREVMARLMKTFREGNTERPGE